MNEITKPNIDNFKKNAINRFFTPGCVMIFKNIGGKNGVYFGSVTAKTQSGSVNLTASAIAKHLQRFMFLGPLLHKYKWLRKKKIIPRINCLNRRLIKKKYDVFEYSSINFKFGTTMTVLGRPKKITGKISAMEEYVVPILYNERVVYIRMYSRKNPRKFWKKIS